MNAQHTPGLGTLKLADKRTANQQKAAQGGYPVKAYSIRHDCDVCAVELRGCSYETANAIVTAYNAHAELLAALRELLWLNPHAIGTASAIAAIAKATGETP